MPIVAPEDGYLTVLNLFTTDTAEKQEKLLGAMREIVDSAAYPGWISSTMHAGVAAYGTANLIQWRSGEDLEKRYAGEEFRHRTLPVFRDITTSIRLLQTQVVSTHRAPDYGPDRTEIAVARDDLTVIDVYGVAAGDQAELAAALGAPVDAPGYRSHTVLSGTRAQGFDGPFVVVYAQWADEASYAAYRPAAELTARATSHSGNTYRAVHSRSADLEAAR